MSNLRCPHC